MKAICLHIIKFGSVTLKKVMLPVIGAVMEEVHYFHYLLSDGGHYITADGEYYQCKETNV